MRLPRDWDRTYVPIHEYDRGLDTRQVRSKAAAGLIVSKREEDVISKMSHEGKMKDGWIL